MLVPSYLLWNPLLLNEEPEELVGHGSRAEIPGSIVTGAVGVSTSKRVSTAESNHFAVVKAHASKDGTDVLLILGSIRKASIGCASGNIPISTAWSPWDIRALHLLDSA